MLKLRRHNRDVNVIVKDSEGTFTRQLKIAFVIALSIHLVLFFGFHITKLKFHYFDSPSSSAVVAEAPNLQGVTFAVAEAAKSLDKRIPIPPEPQPLLGSPYDITLAENESNQISTPHHEAIEPLLLMPKMLSQRRPPPQPIELVVSGDIHKLFSGDSHPHNPLPKMPQKATHLDAARVVFAVAIDKNGNICWHDIVEKTSVDTLDALAEQILAQMKFAPPGNILARGTIEVHYHLRGETR